MIKDNPLLDYAPILDVFTDEDTAFLYCLTLSHDGYKDWRFPTREEFNAHSNIWYEGKNYTNSSGYAMWRVLPVRSKEEI